MPITGRRSEKGVRSGFKRGPGRRSRKNNLYGYDLASSQEALLLARKYRQVHAVVEFIRMIATP
jgi:hypothetical protein